MMPTDANTVKVEETVNQGRDRVLKQLNILVHIWIKVTSKVQVERERSWPGTDNTSSK